MSNQPYDNPTPTLRQPYSYLTTDYAKVSERFAISPTTIRTMCPQTVYTCYKMVRKPMFLSNQ